MRKKQVIKSNSAFLFLFYGKRVKEKHIITRMLPNKLEIFFSIFIVLCYSHLLLVIKEVFKNCVTSKN